MAGLQSEGIDYRGTLYVGIMITKNGAKVVEFNVRFGDPECQVLMPLIESDALELINDIANGNLEPFFKPFGILTVIFLLVILRKLDTK